MRNHCFSANNHNIASKAQRFAILFARHLLEQSLAPNVQHLLVPDLLRILSEGFEKEQIAVCQCLSRCAPYLGDKKEAFIHELNKAKESFRFKGLIPFAVFEAELKLQSQRESWWNLSLKMWCW